MNKKIGFSVIGLFLGVAAVLISLPNSRADLELENAFFNIESYKALCADCETSKGGDLATADLDVETRYLLTGNIEINEIDTDTFSTRKTIIEGVSVRMTVRGIIAELGIRVQRRFRIKGLRDNTVADIFASEFGGTRVGLSLIANLAGMYLYNDNGISILDNEGALKFGAGIEAGHVGMIFSLDNVSTDVKVTINSNGERVVKQELTDTVPNVLRKALK